MSSPIINQVSYLRATRTFPSDETLPLELSKSYLDIATSVNNRTIGLYPQNTAAITGEGYYFNNQKQQVLRRVYTLSSTGTINHELKVNEIDRFINCYGSWTDGTNWYGAIFASINTIPGQVTFYITPTQIVVQSAGIAVVQRVTIVLHWISNV